MLYFPLSELFEEFPTTQALLATPAAVTVPNLKPHYRSGVDNLASDFFSPCLQKATYYRRAAGYFSSMALLTWAEALPRLISGNHLKIDLIAAPEMSTEDISVFRELTTAEKRAMYRKTLVQRILDEVIVLTQNPGSDGSRARILAWLVANERLELKFAFARHMEAPGIFHEKMGIFDFDGGLQVAFTGSANETYGGHHLNYESIDVYLSWMERDAERVRTKVTQFDEAWSDDATGLHVETPTPETVARLRERAPNDLSDNTRVYLSSSESEPHRWRHQDEAVEAFLEKRRGVLEMATGTGKTHTTLKILDQLLEKHGLCGAIVATDGTDLLDQWVKELDRWAMIPGRNWLVFRHFERHKDLGEFLLDGMSSILVISRRQLPSALRHISPDSANHMLIVHDEVHGLGVPSLVRELPTEHKHFRWRLGLSATPSRTYDAEGNRFIQESIGPTVYSFPLESAIARGVLCEFDYIPLDYILTDGDRKRLSTVYARRSARKREGKPMSNEEFWTELSKVYKTAEMKPSVFAEYLKGHPKILQNCIVFVETKEYGNRLLVDMHEYTTKYRTYYAEDDRVHLEQFARNEIDCLITCHRISQGIDIRNVRTVVLFASAKSRLETIQRIGRCLRIDPKNPGKRALVVDFVRSDAVNIGTEDSKGEKQEYANADEERFHWLSALAGVRRSNEA